MSTTTEWNLRIQQGVPVKTTPKAARFISLVTLLSMTLLEGCTCSGEIEDRVQGIAFATPVQGAIFSPDDDLVDSEEGIQIDVEVTVHGVKKGTPVVLSSSDGESAVTGEVSGGRVTFEGYTISQGDSVLRASINEQDVSPTCDTTTCAEVAVKGQGITKAVPVPAITSPAVETEWTIADDSQPTTPGFFHEIVVSLDPVTHSTGTLELLNGEAVLAGPDDIGVGVASHAFADVSFSLGDYSLVARYTDSLGAVTTSAAVSVTVSGDGPPVTISSPVAGAHLTNAAFSVSLTSTGEPRPRSCQLLVDTAPVGDPVSWADNAVGNDLVIDAALPEGEHALQASCTDWTFTAVTGVVTITIDDTAPGAPVWKDEDPADLEVGATPLIFDSANRYVNTHVADNSAESAGLQHDVSLGIIVADRESTEGWIVELTGTLVPSGEGEGVNISPAPVTLAVEATSVVFSDLDFGDVDGTLALSAKITDLAGNVSPTAHAVFEVDRTPPTLEQVSPDPLKSAYNLADNDGGDETSVSLRFEYLVGGGVLEGDCAATPAACVSLEVTPTASLNTSALDYPDDVNDTTIYTPAVEGSVYFTRNDGSLIGFQDDTFSAVATIFDEAGNKVSLTHQFTVEVLAPSLAITLPAVTVLDGNQPLLSGDDISENPHFQTNFTVVSVGFANETLVNLCSSIAPPGGIQVQCQWGSDGQVGGPDAGYIIAQKGLTGTVASAYVQFTGVSLAEGAQKVHAEITGGTMVSSFESYGVDSVPPSVTSLVFSAQNDPSNDGSAIVLNATEGVAANNKLAVDASVHVDQIEEGQAVRVYSNFPAADTLVGSGTTDSSGDAVVTLQLEESSEAQVLDVRTEDLTGNSNDHTNEIQQAVLVDITAAVVSVSAPAFDPYTSANGVINENGTSGDTSDDTITATVNVSVSDNFALEATTVSLARYSDAAGETLVEGTSASVNLNDPATGKSVNFEYPLPAGLHYLRATFVDGVGNTSLSSVQVYRVDLYGPALTLQLHNGAGATLDCSNSSAPCEADVLAPSNNRVQLDTSAGVDFCPSLYGATCPAAAEAGSNLMYTLSGCANSAPGIEDCAAAPISVFLESRSNGGAFALVFESSFGASGDAGVTTYFDEAATYAFDAGLNREVRLVAVDKNGNTSVSNSIFLKLNLGGVNLGMERLDSGGAGTGELLADSAVLSAATNLAVAPNYGASFQVAMTPISDEVPVQVEVAVSGALINQTVSSTSISGAGPYTVNFTGVNEIPLGVSGGPGDTNANVVTVTVWCAGSVVCGLREYSNVVADIDAPSYQFDRCSLSALAVPIEGQGTHYVDGTSCQSANAVDGADLLSGQSAIWNQALDQDAGQGGFSINSLVVLAEGVESGQIVSLSYEGGGANAQAGSGCGDGDINTTCSATFSGIHLPTLPGGGAYSLSVSFTDVAGNVAVADSNRATPEVITAVTDVTVPNAPAPVACVGESTAPTNGDTVNANTQEDASCAALCTSESACSRRKGNVTLSWTASGDDGAGGGQVASYKVLVAGLEIPYNGTTYSSCGEVLADGELEQNIPVVSSAAPGATETHVVSGLFLHRDYCFAVVAVDDVGNEADVAGNQVSRSLPLLNNIPGQGTPPHIVPFDPQNEGSDDARFYNQPSYGTGDVVNLGDMDGDGRSDFSFPNYNATSFKWELLVFISSQSTTSPTFTISAPSGDIAGAFGNFIAGGDFDGDGKNDLAVCSPELTTVTDSGSLGADAPGANGGAVYLYFGVDGTGLAHADNSGDAELPSLIPDVALLGPAGSLLCFQAISLANVDGSVGDELVFITKETSNQPGVYGFSGGSKARFGATPAKVNLRLSQSPDGSAPGIADFKLRGKNVGENKFPTAMTMADVNGDSILDIAVSDYLADHDGASSCNNCGEVYVWTGGVGLTGALPAPDAGSPQLMHTVRYIAGAALGRMLFTMKQPNSADPADWILVKRGSNVFVLKGSQSAGGLTPSVYPVGGGGVVLDALSREDWDGTVAPEFGWVVASLGEFDGHGGTDVMVAPGFTGTGAEQYVFLYSYDDEPASSTYNELVKRVVMRGPDGFGQGLCTSGNYFNDGVSASGLIMSTYYQPAFPGVGALFYYR